MVCKNCIKFDKDIFNHKCNVFGNRHSLVLFLLNIILNIKKKWKEFRTCDGIDICLVCQLNTYYFEYEHKISKNCLNLDFLSKLREEIISYLHLLLHDNSHFVCQIIHEGYQYHHKDWFTGNDLYLNLEDCLLKFEQEKINKVLSQKIEVKIEPILLKK